MLEGQEIDLDYPTEPKLDKPRLRERAGGLDRQIESIDKVLATPEWKNLKKLLLDEQVESLEKQLLLEAKKSPVEPTKLYKLQGQITQSYNSLEKWVMTLRQERDGIKGLLQDK